MHSFQGDLCGLTDVVAQHSKKGSKGNHRHSHLRDSENSVTYSAYIMTFRNQATLLPLHFGDRDCWPGSVPSGMHLTSRG